MTDLAVLLPLLGALVVAAVPRSEPGLARAVAVLAGTLELALLLALVLRFDPQGATVQMTSTHAWLPAHGIAWSLGVDGSALPLLLLLGLAMPLCSMIGERLPDARVLAGLLVLEAAWVTVVLAEGLAELMPDSFLEKLPRDEHGHISLGRIDLGKLIAKLVTERYEAVTGRKKKVAGVQLGYESRCAPPHAFDVMLGSQLGIGAYRALVEENLDGHMVSVVGQLDLSYVPFKELINAQTMKTEVRLIKPGSDYHRLARFLETRTDKIVDWQPGRRREEK
jgi:hypothetical protein